MTRKPLLADRGRTYDSTAPQAPSYAAVAAPTDNSASHSNSTATSARNGGIARNGNGGLPTHTGPKKGWLVTRLQGNIDPNKCDWISVYGCLLTGFTSAVSFTVSFSSGDVLTTGMLCLVCRCI